MFGKLFGQKRGMLMPLYDMLVLDARRRDWYIEGEVPDTIDGRFEMLATLTALALVRLDQSGLKREGVFLTEIFIEDMDGQMRQIGIGADRIGKHMGKLLAALGGRISQLLSAGAEGGAEADAALRGHIERNIFRGNPPQESAIAYIATHLTAYADTLAQMDDKALLRGVEL